MRVAILGLGLIGGSVALALRAAPEGAGARYDIAAWSPSGAGPARALEQGSIDAAPSRLEDALADADFVLLAAPALACLDLIEQLAGPLRSALPDDATVSDVASTKRLILELADARGLRFVGGHPMAGREIGGFDGAQAGLFLDRPWVIVPGRHATPADQDRVERLASATGARPVVLDAAAHDVAVAAISHLPLVVAAALVESVLGPRGGRAGVDQTLARQLAASGWRDTTRLARGEVQMGAAIAATNTGPLAARLRDLRAVIDEWIGDLERVPEGVAPAPPEVAAITERLRAARDLLERP